MSRFKHVGLLLAVGGMLLMQSAAHAQVRGRAVVQPAAPGDGGFLKNLLGITALEEDVAELQGDVAGLKTENQLQQAQINALLTALALLTVQVGNNSNDIDTLFECKDMLKERIERLEAVIDCPDDGQFEVCEIDGMNYCVDTFTDTDNCGECGNECEIYQNCVEGECVDKPCDPVNDCHTAELNLETGECDQTPVDNTTLCDDGLGCTAVDVCQNGICVGFGTPCGPGESCTEDGEGGAVCE